VRKAGPDTQLDLHPGRRRRGRQPLGIAQQDIGRADLTRRAPDVAALTEFFDRHNFGPLLRRQAERLALVPLTPAAFVA